MCVQNKRNIFIKIKLRTNIFSFNMTSPPGSHPQLPHPSPGSGNLMPSSPMPAQSPNPNLAYIQSHPDSSPFAAMSPAAANWLPGSPRPSPRPGQSPEHKIQPQGMSIKLKQQQFFFIPIDHLFRLFFFA